MKKGIILYKSKYGVTKKYADWLAEATGFETVETDKAKISEVKECDVIILGGGIYASGMAGLSFQKKHIGELKDKQIIVFCDGASPYEEKAFHEIKNHNMKDNLKDIPLFYCRGMWNPKAMSFIDRNLCKMLQKAVAKKDPKDYEMWEAALMKAGDDFCDWTDKKYLEPILECINQEEA